MLIRHYQLFQQNINLVRCSVVNKTATIKTKTKTPSMPQDRDQDQDIN